VSLVEEILSDYLSKWELQALARDHDLPVSRTKEEIADELQSLDEFDPAEAVAFLSVWQLRQICQEHGMPSGAYRDTLAQRVIRAIQDERRVRDRRQSTYPTAEERLAAISPAPQRPPRSQSVRTSRGPIVIEVPSPLPPPIRVHVQSSAPTPIDVHIHPSPPPDVHVRVLPPQTAAWGFVGVIVAVVFGGIYFATTGILGSLWGVGIGLLTGVAAALLLLLTEGWWAPKLNLLADRGRPPRVD
jgi:hypothetical protein